MSDDSLIEALPDLIAFVRKDGTILKRVGGRRLTAAESEQPIVGRKIDEIWPEPVAQLLQQMIRRALASRGSTDAQFNHDGRQHDVRVSAQGRERVLCVIRELANAAPVAGERDGVRSTGQGAMERRAFFGRLKQSVAEAALRERQLAVALIHVDGLHDVGRIIDFSVGEQIATALLQRLPAPAAATDGGRGNWYVGQLGENLLAAVIESYGDREALREVVTSFRESLAQPVSVGDASFSVTPSAGVAILGEDASQTGPLLEHARAAMLEARRSEGRHVHFYSDTLRLRSLARLDFERELRTAVAEDELALRYAARHDLATGRLVAVHAYLRWPHPLRGEVKAAEFLPIAESTGLASPLSRWALQRLRRDLPALRAAGASDMRFSFGALRQHLASDALAKDIEGWLASGEVAPHEVELRIAEKTIAALGAPGKTLRRLADLGVSIVIDEFGRGYTSLPRLARLPVWGLQLDRGLVVASARDEIAAKATRAAVAIAHAMGIMPLAPGVDDDGEVERLRGLGCPQGLGDRFGEILRAEATRERAVG